MTTYIGIDPGKSGAVAFMDGDDLRVFDAPMLGKDYAEQEMVALLRCVGPVKAAIERQQARPEQGRTAMFTIGLGYGMWRGILASLGIPYDVVEPTAWKRVVGLPAGSKKPASVGMAQRLFPASADLFTGPRGGQKDGRAEAALIAEYRRRIG